MFRSALLGALALVSTAGSAFAQAPSNCIDASVPKGAFAAHDGHWLELTHDQRLFLAGVYVVNPQTPAGLPYGDRAALATIPGNAGGMIFFLDGDKACTPMPVPKPLIDLLGEVAAGGARHEGDKL